MIGHSPRTLTFGGHHLDDLAPARDQIGEQSRHLVWKRTRHCLGGFGKMRDHRGIDRVGLSPLAKRLGKSSHLRRVDHNDWQFCRRQAGRYHCLETTCCLDRNNTRHDLLQPFRQILNTSTGASGDKALTARTHRNIQSILTDVDSDNTSVHLIPSLRKRARNAAQATVRVRWNGRRRPMLIHGLGVPRGRRSIACHRAEILPDNGPAKLQGGLSAGLIKAEKFATPSIFRDARESRRGPLTLAPLDLSRTRGEVNW